MSPNTLVALKRYLSKIDLLPGDHAQYQQNVTLMAQWTQCDEKDALPLWFPQAHHPRSNMRKTPDESHLRGILQTPDQSSSKTPKSGKPRKSEKPSQPRGAKGDVWTDCHVGPRGGERALGETEEICINCGLLVNHTISAVGHGL